MLVEVQDPAGTNPKLRPVVIVTPANEVEVADTLIGVAVTTSFSEPLPENQIPLPWQPEARTITKLSKPSVAVCNWLVSMERSAIVEMKGVVPPRVLEKIIERLPR